ncbi:hypothetical protein HMPREF0240_00454 [Clostridium sp. D5]|nr:hypothetical protein HMPREF0240_00454 [Clostridium sp. D5]
MLSGVVTGSCGVLATFSADALWVAGSAETAGEGTEGFSAAASFAAVSVIFAGAPGVSDANGTIFETSVSTEGTAEGFPVELLAVFSFTKINSSDTDNTSISIFLNHISFC